MDNLTLNSPPEGATRVTAWTNNTYADFTLDATGLTWMGDNTIFFMLRSASMASGVGDVENAAPACVTANYSNFQFADNGSNKPKLVVDNTAPAGAVVQPSDDSQGFFNLSWNKLFNKAYAK